MKFSLQGTLSSDTDAVVVHSPTEWTIIAKNFDPMDVRIVAMCHKKNLPVNVEHVGLLRVVSYVARKGMLAIRLQADLKEAANEQTM